MKDKWAQLLVTLLFNDYRQVPTQGKQAQNMAMWTCLFMAYSLGARCRFRSIVKQRLCPENILLTLSQGIGNQ